MTLVPFLGPFSFLLTLPAQQHSSTAAAAAAAAHFYCYGTVLLLFVQHMYNPSFSVSTDVSSPDAAEIV